MRSFVAGWIVLRADSVVEGRVTTIYMPFLREQLAPSHAQRREKEKKEPSSISDRLFFAELVLLCNASQDSLKSSTHSSD